ncbi:glycosyltransferase [Oscillatoria acuminata]|uniref:Glycosyltransferase n=1 Tax=Oscillatoria acuminata PCC 6304 TaxID=56110 RepID=K9THS3_9CYAN|nr:glycosyltransferase [Oscillatoria acuminata]AFY81681.1 glycosyltransferase [Oscillatoria acuminata PCC 6304]
MITSKSIALISVHGDPAIEIGKEEAGGQNVYVRKVGEALGNLGWQVDMFTRKSNATQSTVVQHTPNCRTIRLVAGPEEFVPRQKIYEYVPQFVQEFLKFQEQQRVDYRLVHTNYWISAAVGMELKKFQPMQQVHTYHSLGAVKYKAVSTIPMIASTRLGIEKACLENADRIVATSPQEKEHMRTLVSSKGLIDVIPCGTDIHQFGGVSQAIAREKLGIHEESSVVFYVGRFDRRKGIETLVRAMSRSTLRGQQDVRLMIGGGWRPGQSDGKERDRIGSLVEKLGIADLTTFPGRIGHDELPLYYAAANVCVVPSHYEPFGLVAIEAMASRTPVVASDVGGLQYTVVSEETGLLCPAQDDAAFAVAIDRILAHPDWQNELGQAARERVESQFSWDGVARQLSHLYSTLLIQSSQSLDPVTA